MGAVKQKNRLFSAKLAVINTVEQLGEKKAYVAAVCSSPRSALSNIDTVISRSAASPFPNHKPRKNAKEKKNLVLPCRRLSYTVMRQRREPSLRTEIRTANTIILLKVV